MTTKKPNTNLTKTKLKEIQALAKKLTQHREDISKLRDKMRDDLYEFETLIESLDTAHQDLFDGTENIQFAIDTLSEYL